MKKQITYSIFGSLLLLVLIVSCQSEPTTTEAAVLTAEQVEKYTKQGLEYANSTQGVLGKNLVQQIQKNGIENAIGFCNVKAYPLTDSMATFHDVQIKRVSDKNRNPKNQANEAELKHIETFKKAIKKGESPRPIIEERGKSILFYAPIMTNEMCLKCHGTKESLSEKVAATLANLYPNDKAIGYKANEVRGIWSIEFPQ